MLQSLLLILPTALPCQYSLHFTDENIDSECLWDPPKVLWLESGKPGSQYTLFPECVYFALLVTSGQWFQWAENFTFCTCLFWTWPSIEPNVTNQVIEAEVVIAYQIFHVFPLISHSVLQLGWDQMTPTGQRIRSRMTHVISRLRQLQPSVFLLSLSLSKVTLEMTCWGVYIIRWRELGSLNYWMEKHPRQTPSDFVYGKNQLVLCQVTMIVKLLCYCSTTNAPWLIQ